MTDMLDEFDFSGAEGAKVAEASNKGGGDFQREIMYLTLKADPASVHQGKHQAIVRVVTEYERKPWMDGFGVTPYNFAWITVGQHYAPTKQKPPYVKEDRQWQTKWNAVCRKDKIFAKKYANSCYLCDQLSNKTSDRTWALAVEREQVVEDGKVVGYRDKTREVFDRDEKGELIVESTDGEGKKTYRKKVVPAWLVLNYGWKNFFNALSGQAQWNQTVMDRDYVIQRSGEKSNDTNYTFIPLDPITVPAENPWGLPAGAKYDLSTIIGQTEQGRPVPLVEAVYPDMPDLRRIIAEKTSDDYYGYYFVPGWVPEGFVEGQNGSASNGGGSNQIILPGGGGQQQGYQPPQAQPQQAPNPAQPAPQAQASAPSGDALAALKDRVLGGVGGGATGPSQQ